MFTYITSFLRDLKKRSHRSPDEMRIHPDLVFRPSDQFIVSFPRSGNTWLRHLVKEVLIQIHPEIPPPEDLEQIVPTVHRSPVSTTDATTWGSSGRIFKSHNIRDLHPYRVVYIFRDAADSLVSYYHQYVDKAKLKGTPLPNLTLEEFCDRTAPRWCMHVESAIVHANRNRGTILMVAYEHLLKDPKDTLSKITSFLNLDPTSSQLEQAIDRCSFSQLKSREISRKPVIAEKNFFRKGRIGAGREELSPEITNRVDSITKVAYDQCLRLT